MKRKGDDDDDGFGGGWGGKAVKKKSTGRGSAGAGGQSTLRGKPLKADTYGEAAGRTFAVLEVRWWDSELFARY